MMKPSLRLGLSFLVLVVSSRSAFAQIPTFHAPLQLQDTTVKPDDTLRIRNLNPYFSLHVDSSLYYQLEINKDPGRYFFFMKDAPVGMKVKESGLITFRADKSYFLSGRLKYDVQYRVRLGVQNLDNPKDRIDTSFTIQFFTTDVIPSRVKPTVSSLLTIDEGDTINFRVQCEAGTYPIESINFFSNVPIRGNTNVTKCDDLFTWSPPYDFTKETDSGKTRLLILYFVGTNKMFQRDTAIVKIYVKDALDYPFAKSDYETTLKNIRIYMLRLKYAFFNLDKKVKHTKNTRQDFDISAADGLHHAQDRGILHRDIKPSNILLSADGQPLLLDFNLAQAQDEDATHATIGGTVAYMSPEHLRALLGRTPALIRQVDRRSDIYSLGMVLAEMLTGRRPFEQSGSYSVLPRRSGRWRRGAE